MLAAFFFGNLFHQENTETGKYHLGVHHVAIQTKSLSFHQQAGTRPGNHWVPRSATLGSSLSTTRQAPAPLPPDYTASHARTWSPNASGLAATSQSKAWQPTVLGAFPTYQQSSHHNRKAHVPPWRGQLQSIQLWGLELCGYIADGFIGHLLHQITSPRPINITDLTITQK